MKTTFNRTSAPRGKEWLGLRQHRLKWAEPQPRRLKHNNQTAAGRSLVIMRQQICYCSCWRWQWWQRRCKVIGGEALVGGRLCG